MGSALRRLQIGWFGAGGMVCAWVCVGGCLQAAQEPGQLLLFGRRQHLEKLRGGRVAQRAEPAQLAESLLGDLHQRRAPVGRDSPAALIRAFVRLWLACAMALNCSISSTVSGSGAAA